MNDNMEDLEYECREENLFIVLDTMKKGYVVLEEIDTKELCTVYDRLFPPQDGYYTISYLHMNQLNQCMVDKTLLQLMDKGLVEMVWMDDKNDFGFQLTETGKQLTNKMFGS